MRPAPSIAGREPMLRSQPRVKGPATAAIQPPNLPGCLLYTQTGAALCRAAPIIAKPLLKEADYCSQAATFSGFSLIQRLAFS